MLKRKCIRVILICAAAVLAVAFFVVMFSTIKQQQLKLDELEKERQLKQQELDELNLQYNSIEEMLKYTESNEFLLRYAREHLGYMLKGDIRIDVDNPSAVIPTYAPGSTLAPNLDSSGE